MDYIGAFIDIYGKLGFVHISEISWETIDHPCEILEIGQEVEVKVIGIDENQTYPLLSIRQLNTSPLLWVDQIKNLEEGQLVDGKITRLTNYGAFLCLLVNDINGELEGLIPISEISEKSIEHPKEILQVGDVLSLRILRIEEDTHRIGLSVRRVDSPEYKDLDWKRMTEDFDRDNPH